MGGCFPGECFWVPACQRGGSVTAQTTATIFDVNFHTYPTTMTNALGHQTVIDYDYTLGVPIWERDANNQYTYARYDVFGRITRVARPLDNIDTAPTLEITYHDTSPYWTEVSQRIDGTSFYRVRKFYDGLGRLIQTQTAGAVLTSGLRDIVTDFAYNGAGQVVSQSVPYEIIPGSGYHTPEAGQPHTTTEYDLLGRVRIQTAPDGAVSENLYSMVEVTGLGWVRQSLTRDALLHETTTLTDTWGRTVQVLGDGASPWVGYTYDSKDQLVGVTQSGITPTLSLTYDLAGRKTQMVDPDMGAWSYTYDALGNLSTQTDARGCTISLSYDDLNRLTGKTYTGPGACDNTPDVGYTYDNGWYGARTGMTDGSGSTTWQYDGWGRMSQETKTITGSGTFVTGWVYNSADLISWMRYPLNNASGQGETVSYSYHPQLQVNGVTGTSTYVQSTAYDAAGRVDVRTLGGNTLKTGYVYYPWTSLNGQGRLQQIQTGIPSNLTSLQNLEYAYDLAGNVDWIKDWKAGSPQLQDFGYDALNRLTTAAATGGSGGTYAQEIYAYDAITGFMTSKAGVGYTYNAPNHAHAVSLAGTTNYSYDANGNQTVRDPSGSTMYTLTYDAENRLSGVSGSAVAAFVYDGDGRRVKGTVGSTTTTIYLGNYFEWTGSTSTMKKYYYADGVRVAVRTGTSADSVSLKWLLGDHLGSTAITANSGGTKSAEVRYKPWGENRYTSGTAPTTFRYTGQRQESGIGLYFYNARWYDPSLSRFVSADTLVPQPGNVLAWDRYSYTRNNPVKYTDPSGHKECEGTISCNHLSKSFYTEQYYQNGLEQEFGWSIGSNFTYQETKLLTEVAWDMQLFYSNQTGGGGKLWMDKNIGNLRFTKGDTVHEIVSILNKNQSTSLVLPISTIHLADDFLRGGHRHVAHEINHVIDNRIAGGLATFFGGGPADDLIREVGGNPTGLRFWNGNLDVPNESRFIGNAYLAANTSIADYFAESLAFLLYPNIIEGTQEIFPKPGVQDWFHKMILQAK